MALWTLAQLKTRAKYKADMVYSDFVEDSEWTEYISTSYARFYDIITTTYSDHYIGDPVQFVVASGNSYTLDTNFYKLVGVDFLDGSDWFEVRPFNFNERNSNSFGYINRRFHPRIHYRLVGSKMLFIPVDQSTGTFRYWYIPLFTPLVLDTDTIDGLNGWEEFIVLDAAIKALLKEESDTSRLEAHRDMMEKLIMENAQNRDAGQPQKITDIYANDYARSFAGR